MTQLTSRTLHVGPAILPPYMGRRLKYHTAPADTFVMPVGYEDYTTLIQRILAQAGNVKGMVTATVDESYVEAGMSQRRPGPHVDGCFIPEKQKWGNDSPGGGWNHFCNHLRAEKVQRMPVIVVSSVPGCMVWEGKFNGEPKNDGDLSHIQEQLNKAPNQVLGPNWAYLLSPDCIHESMRFKVGVQRTFLRLALPVDYWQPN